MLPSDHKKHLKFESIFQCKKLRLIVRKIRYLLPIRASSIGEFSIPSHRNTNTIDTGCPITVIDYRNN